MGKSQLDRSEGMIRKHVLFLFIAVVCCLAGCLPSTPVSEGEYPDIPVPPTDIPGPPTDVPAPVPDTLASGPRPGPQIAFQTDRDGNEEIYVMNADGSNVVRLTDHPADDRHPCWSPVPGASPN